MDRWQVEAAAAIRALGHDPDGDMLQPDDYWSGLTPQEFAEAAVARRLLEPAEEPAQFSDPEFVGMLFDSVKDGSSWDTFDELEDWQLIDYANRYYSGIPDFRARVERGGASRAEAIAELRRRFQAGEHD